MIITNQKKQENKLNWSFFLLEKNEDFNRKKKKEKQKREKKNVKILVCIVKSRIVEEERLLV